MRAARFALAALAAAASLAVAAPKPAPAPTPDKAQASERELKELRARIEQLQARLAAAEKSSGEATDQLRETGKAVSEAQRALFDLAQRRREIERDLQAVAKREEDVRAGIASHEQLAGRLLRLQYQQGAPDRLRLLLEGRDAASVSRHIAYYQYIQRARAEVIVELRRQGEALAALEREAVQRRDELAQNEAEQAREARRLEKERAARAAVVAKLAGDIARGRREIGRLKRDEGRLARLVEEIARALAARPATPGGRRRIEEAADASASSRPFQALKGQLKLPVRGELANRYGAPREEAGTSWKGLFIKAPAGEAVNAVADGRVVYADWLRGFGNLLILDHGKGFMSLYGYNDGLLRRVGEKVRAGDPVASVGASGGEAVSGLYFELRRDGKTFDPMLWVK